jgi:hypothetical protein
MASMSRLAFAKQVCRGRLNTNDLRSVEVAAAFSEGFWLLGKKNLFGRDIVTAASSCVCLVGFRAESWEVRGGGAGF